MSTSSRVEDWLVSSSAERPAGRVEERSGFLPDRIIHLHVTRLCNLACLHCYPSPPPQQRRGGRSRRSVARVDPPAGRGLPPDQSVGWRTARLSLDPGAGGRGQGAGFSCQHDHQWPARHGAHGPGAPAPRRRGHQFRRSRSVARPDARESGCLERASAAVHRLASTGRRVGAAISLTREAIPELLDLADHLVAQGATSLQIRPVARAGRARSLPDATFARANDSARIYLVVEALRQELPGVQVHCDLAPARGLWRQRGAYSALLGECEDGCPSERPARRSRQPLVVTESGMLSRLPDDFDPRFDVGRSPR